MKELIITILEKEEKKKTEGLLIKIYPRVATRKGSLGLPRISKRGNLPINDLTIL